MFLELPELTSSPFPSLETIKYEGPINRQTLDFLTVHSPQLKFLDLICSSSVLNPKCLQNLHLFPKYNLESLKVELVIESNGSMFMKEVRKIIDGSDNLKILGCKHLII